MAMTKFGSFQKNSLGMGFGGRGGSARVNGHASLNLTPMIDMFTILLVFLIKSYSVDPAYLTPTQGISLAETTSDVVAPDQAVLFVGKDGILIDGKLVVPFQNGVIKTSQMKNGELPELRRSLEAMAAKTKFIAEHNSSVQFSGILILQADRELPFESMKPILRSAGMAGYHDIKFAGTFNE